MIANQKSLFELPPGVVYLDCASRSPLMKAVTEAGRLGLRRKVEPWSYTMSDIDAEAERARHLFAALIGAEAGDIAIQPATSYGVATAAAMLPLGEGQAVVVLEGQFPSNVYVWRAVAAERGARLVTVPRPENGDWTPAVIEALGPATAIAALPICHWTDGGLLDIDAIQAKCRETGAALVVDATQSAGAMAIDVGRIEPDFLVASAYKWLMCPYTLAFLYASPSRQLGRPLEFHSWNHADPVRLLGAEKYADDFAAGARRYDMGERNNPINMPMAVAALERLSEWGPAEIAATLAPLTDAAVDMARDRGWRAPPKRVAHFVGVRVPGGLPADLWQRLRDEGVHVSVRGTAIRVSPHLYNDMADVERLFGALDELIGGG